MKRTYSMLALLSVILGLGLGGCLRSASAGEPAETPTATLSIPILVNTQVPSMKDILSGTQTALARTSVAAATFTPAVTSTPLASSTSATTATYTPYPSATPGRPIRASSHCSNKLQRRVKEHRNRREQDENKH